MLLTNKYIKNFHQIIIHSQKSIVIFAPNVRALIITKAFPSINLVHHLTHILKLCEAWRLKLATLELGF